MSIIFKGLTFFNGKSKHLKEGQEPKDENLYVKASEDLRKSAEELKKATRKLQESFRSRQDTLNKLVSVFNSLADSPSGKREAVSKARQPQQAKKAQQQTHKGRVGESELFEVYREACINFVETEKTYYFKLLGHSDFLSAMYRRYMGNLRYYDHEFFRLSDRKPYNFNELEAYVANQVILAVNRMGREKFIREGHQALYSDLCSRLLPQSVNQ